MEPNNTQHIFVGNNITVRENVNVTINCTMKKMEMNSKGPLIHTRIRWYINNSIVNIYENHNLSLDVVGEIGTYTCEVCDKNENNCTNTTSFIKACGKKCLTI